MTTDTIGQIKKFLMEYKLESNIPINHHYWDLLTDFRAGKLGISEREYRVLKPEPKAPPSGTPGQIQAKLVQLRNQNRATLQSFGFKEPTIPFTHDYWFIQNQIKGLQRELAELT